MGPAEVVAVDIGGTFIDYVATDGASAWTHKELSDPDDVAGAFMRGLRSVAPQGCRRLVHGTTIATNALLERSGARTAFVGTEGFGDLLELGRQDRTGLYDLMPRRPVPLVPRELRFELPERVVADGRVERPLTDEALEKAVATLSAAGIEAVSICLLFSYLRPEHELAVAERLSLAMPGLFVSRSSRVLPEIREYERASTTTINAYVSLPIRTYIRGLGSQLAEFGLDRFNVMQSNGGVIDAAEAEENGARLLLSGPAGGVVGGYETARTAGYPRAITLDMGGTSTDVSLCDGAAPMTAETIVDGLPVRLPAIDIHTVGAGGGSIARIDDGGLIRVGPRSAGSHPGPAAYGLGGDEPTVTDAHVVLGRLGTSLLGGRFLLDIDAAERVVTKLGNQAGLTTTEAARGIIQVANASMERAIRRVSVDRGRDPRNFALVSFGGCGPLHACELADALGIPAVLVPRHPGVASAMGMLMARETRDWVRTERVALDGQPASELARLWRPLEILAATASPDATLARTVDLRYEGQAYELEVAADDLEGLVERFHDVHRQRYGYSEPGRPIELVNVRLRAVGAPTGPNGAPTIATGISADQSPADRDIEIARSTLGLGDLIEGPRLIVEPDTSTWIPSGWGATLDTAGNVVLTRGRERA